MTRAGDDYIDSRDLIQRMEELQGEREALADELTDDWDAAHGEELKALVSANEQGEGYGDWAYGEQMTHERKWEEYAQQLAEDIGAIDPSAGWPLNCIDWEEAAEELKADYCEIDFGGHTYYISA